MINNETFPGKSTVMKYLATLVALFTFCTGKLTPQIDDVLKIRMPGVIPTENDFYVCTSIKVKPREQYAVKYEPDTDASVAHHMLLYGCDEPAEDKLWWKCSQQCKRKSSILYAWAKNAPALTLPKDVGYRIGGSSGLHSLVLQIHYASKFSPGHKPDHSGLNVYLTETTPNYMAGIFLMMAYSDVIPPHTPKYNADVSCKYGDDEPIFPFAYRTHAHALSRVISGYQVNSTGYHLIGKGNPHWPQAFYPSKTHLKISRGDIMIARCSYNSTTRDTSTYMGATHTDEMCNLYIMYYTDGKRGRAYSSCGGNHYRKYWINAPKDSDKMLPYNATMEEKAIGAHHPHPGPHHNNFPKANTAPKLGLKADPDWPTLTDDVQLGQVAGVATDRDGNVVIFHRGSRAWDGSTFNRVTNVYNESGKNRGPIREDTLLMFDPKGRLIKKWGSNLFYLPHGLTIDNENNIWVTDVALHQVFKFKWGVNEPLLVVGTRKIPGSGKKHFCKPTDVAILENGTFYVSDGYCNHRIVQFSAEGDHQLEWGKVSIDKKADGFPAASSFFLPHSITYVKQNTFDFLCVGDRENRRTQCFDLHGKFVTQIHPSEWEGPVYAVAYNNKSNLLFAVKGPNGQQPMTGATFNLVATGKTTLAGTFLEAWFPNKKGFGMPHDVAVSPDGDAIYVADIGDNRVWKMAASYSKEKNTSVKKAKVTHYKPDDTSDEDNLDLEIRSKADEEKAVQSTLSVSSPPILVAILLIVPVVVAIIVTIVIKLKNRRGPGGTSRNRSGNGQFTLGGFLNRRKGFQQLNTNELDHLTHHLNSDSENEMFDIAVTGKA